MASTRRLAAILAADVAGYSRLMGVDEEGTLAALKTHRRDVIGSKIAEHHGGCSQQTEKSDEPSSSSRRAQCRRGWLLAPKERGRSRHAAIAEDTRDRGHRN